MRKIDVVEASIHQNENRELQYGGKLFSSEEDIQQSVRIQIKSHGE